VTQVARQSIAINARFAPIEQVALQRHRSNLNGGSS